MFFWGIGVGLIMGRNRYYHKGQYKLVKPEDLEIGCRYFFREQLSPEIHFLKYLGPEIDSARPSRVKYIFETHTHPKKIEGKIRLLQSDLCDLETFGKES